MSVADNHAYAESQLKEALNRLDLNIAVQTEEFDLEKAIEHTEQALESLEALEDELKIVSSSKQNRQGDEE